MMGLQDESIKGAMTIGMYAQSIRLIHKRDTVVSTGQKIERRVVYIPNITTNDIQRYTTTIYIQYGSIQHGCGKDILFFIGTGGEDVCKDGREHFVETNESRHLFGHECHDNLVSIACRELDSGKRICRMVCPQRHLGTLLLDDHDTEPDV